MDGCLCSASGDACSLTFQGGQRGVEGARLPAGVDISWRHGGNGVRVGKPQPPSLQERQGILARELPLPLPLPLPLASPVDRSMTF